MPGCAMFHFYWVMVAVSVICLFGMFTQPDEDSWARLYHNSRFINYVSAVIMAGWIGYGFLYETTYFLVP